VPRCARVGGSVAAARATGAADLDRDLTRDEVDALVASSTLDELCALAAETRARGPNPRLVTFSPKVFVPLTRACRDACGYCTFASDPADTERVYMTLDEVLDVAERGRRAGATECLFTLGDRPEARYPAARDELRAMGHASTVDYLAHCAGEVLRRVGLLPHCNAGVLTREELAKLRKVSVSQGLMLESATDRLVDQPGAAHDGCESKRPAARLRTTTLAGELRVPFTSGVLIGIGETREERIDALFAIRDADRACAADRAEGGAGAGAGAGTGAARGHVHEIIVQNFRAKSDTRMRDHPEPTLEELLWTAAVARIVFGPHTVVQVPPNLTPEPDDACVHRDLDDGDLDGDGHSVGRREGWRRLLRAGVSDWGGVSPGVTPDHVSPEAPWPHLAELAAVTAEEGYSLAPRLGAQPPYVVGGALDEWVDAEVAPHVRAAADGEGLSRASGWCPGRAEAAKEEEEVETMMNTEGARETSQSSASSKPRGGSDGSDGSDDRRPWRRVRLPRAKDLVGVDGAMLAPRGGVAASPEIEAAIARLASRGAAMAAAAEKGEAFSADDASSSSSSSALELALDRAAAETLFRARGADFDRVCAAADAARREQCGDVVTYVVNRNINYTNACTLSCAFCAFSKGPPGRELELRGPTYLLDDDEVSRRAAEAWDRGATEVCMQGGIHPSFTGEDYVRLLRAARRCAPKIHVHAFSPLEVTHGARTTGVSIPAFIARLRDEGLGSLPGTAAEVLDDAVRAELCPDKISAREWLDVVSAAHDAGVPTTSTMMFGHVDADGPHAWAAHLLALRDAHADSTRRRRRREREREAESGSESGSESGTTGRGSRGFESDAGSNPNPNPSPNSNSSPATAAGFSEFVPLPFVHFEAPTFRAGRSRRGPTLRECVLSHAVARLVLGPAGMTNVQASWVKMGPEMAAHLLDAGCNDLGGTLMNESITRAAGATHGQEMSAGAMEAIIEAAGRAARTRTTLYGDAGEERREAALAAKPLAEYRVAGAR
jgi:FO synthase